MIYDTSLLAELDALVADMHKSNQDLPIAIYGNEGTGKSTFSENLAIFLDRTFDGGAVFSRVAQTFEDFAMKAPDTLPFQVIWWDEAHRFSKRGSYDTDINRVLLEYFQDIRAAMKIYLLCFPELREIDRKVIQRCRLFFETVKRGDSFLVKGWTKEQILATIDCYRLPSAKSKALRWAGMPWAPIRVFRHDYKDFPDASRCSVRNEPISSLAEVDKEYRKLKDGSIRRSEAVLKSYGAKDGLDVANEIVRLSTFKFGSAKNIAYEKIKLAVNEGWAGPEELEVINGKYKIKSDILFRKIVDACLSTVHPTHLRLIVDPPEKQTIVDSRGNIRGKHLDSSIT